jgi:hypothetical protein
MCSPPLSFAPQRYQIGANLSWVPKKVNINHIFIRRMIVKCLVHQHLPLNPNNQEAKFVMSK